MKKKQTQANRYNLQHPNPSAHSGSIENTNEESPSPPIKATTLLLLSLKILRVMFCRAHLKMALFGSSFVVSPENCSALPANRWLFIIATAANLVTENGGVNFLIIFFPTVRLWSWKAISILFRMHKPENLVESLLPRNQTALHQFTFTRQAADTAWAVTAPTTMRWVGGWVQAAHVHGSDATIHALPSQQKSIFIRNFSWNSRPVSKGTEKAL